MTQPDQMDLLRRKVAELGQADVARRIDRSDSCISQIMSGKYQGNPDAVLALVEEQFGGSTVRCPVLGEIPLKRCAEIRKRPFAATNPTRVQLWRACKECKR
jgi:cyanate lyase